MENREIYELTNPQKSIWATEQFFMGTNVNNIAATLTIKENVDLKTLNKAINIFLKNNKSFGLKFEMQNGNLVQYFTEMQEINFEILHLKDKEELRKVAQELSKEIFNIEEENLFKYKLFKLDNGYGGFIIIAHHIISDAGTFSLMGTEIVDNYSKLQKNENIEIKEYSYEDYIKDEKEYEESSKFIKDKEYWNEVFKDIPKVATIPSTKSKANTDGSGKSLREEFVLNQEILSKISEFCKKNKISNFNFFMTIYAIYLSRVSNLKDFVIGTPILNRTNFKEKHTTGMFINTAPLRIKIEDNIDFVTCVKQIAQSSLSMLRYQKYPYQMLLEDLRKKDSTIPVLFDVMLSYQVTKANDRTLEVPYEVEWLPSNTISDSIYIHLHDNDDNGTLNVAYDYQIEKYSKDDIDNIHKRILHIIDQVLSNENCLEQDIEIVTEEEKNKILYEFNNTYTDYPRDKTIVDLFEEQVEKTPNKIAIVCKEEKITYKELDEKSNFIAMELLNKGIKDGETIGIRLERSIYMIISIFACIKAGITYILIENTLPKERIQYILNDSESKALITSNKLNTEDIDTQIIILDENNIKEKNEKIKNINKKLCIIYTSGSTGNPKGVMLSQKGFINLVGAMNNAMHLEICNSFISHASVSFDMFAFELYCCILNGKTLYLTDDIEQKDPIAVSEIIIKNNVDFLLTTPSKIELILSDEKLSKCLSNIKVFLLGGEVFTSSLYNRMKKKTNGNIYNGYGPTEITACCSIKKIEDENNINIGKPVNNTQIYITNNNLSLCPIGIVGELCVAGDGLAFGYINNKELTKKAFTEIKSIDKKVYRTGDLARYNQEGEIEYIGRNDFQVKLHGQRIELGEIERQIIGIDSICNVCVCIKQSQNREILCAYYTANRELNKIELKGRLEKVLPQYMIPAYFLQLEKLPLTMNGKVDRKKLPEPKIETKKESEIIKPKNEIEKELLDIYKKVLKIDNISTTENFFDLGGDSLTAINLTTYIYENLKMRVNIKTIFSNPTIVELAKEISKLGSSEIDTDKISKSEEREYYPVSSAQRRMYYASSIDGDNSVLYNISGGLILEEHPDLEKLNKSFKKVIENNEALRTYFEIQDGELVQKIQKEVDFNIEVEEVKNSNIEEISKDFVRPFDLSKAPLMRVKLANLKNGKALLFIDMHHIISDGTTIKILAKEVSDLYNGKRIDKKEIDYKDFSIWENDRENKLKKQEKYWLKQFEDNIPVLELPTELPRPAMQSFEGKSITKKLDKEVAEKVNELSKSLNITPYMLLIAVYYIILSEYSATNDIVIGTPVACRKEKELLNIIGMFVNTIALRNKINQEDTFEKFVKTIKENCLQAFENEEYPLDKLTKKLNIQRDTSRNMLFDVLFTYQKGSYPTMDFNGIKAEYYVPKLDIAKFDLLLEAVLEEENLTLRFEYCTKLFTEEFIKEFAKHYINILKIVLKETKIKIADIDMIGRDEKARILQKLNDTKTEYERDKTVVQLFEKQVEEEPNKIALVYNDEKLTYRELNQKSNQLANYMINEYNIKEQDKVAIFVKKSLESIISIIATIKAGAIFVPIDVEYPQERIEYILKDSNAKLILTLKEYKNKIKCETPQIDIDLENRIYENKNVLNPKSKINPEDLIYIMYTSGSTGKPKGVMIPHRSVVRLVRNTNYIDFSNCKRILQTGSIVFDACTFEIWGALLNGLSLYVIDKMQLLDCNIFAEYLQKNKIDTLWLTAPLFNQLSEENPYVFEKVKYLLTGGDVLSAQHINLVIDANPNITIINGYGPTENTTFSCCFKIDKKYKENIPIGKAISNSTAYVVSKNGKLQPIGVPGELWVGGDGLAKGYLNREDLTQEKFIENPFGDGMVYKTGDSVKLLSNGNIEFIGRLDNQVKIRGFRVEISEIENVIKKYPDILKLVIIVKEINGNKTLVTYFTSHKKVNTQDIVLYLQERLPSYMIPQYIMQVDMIPLTINGKVDKEKLPIPEKQTSNKYVPPENEVQEQLCMIWSKLFNTKRISILDNFFELGGDSLLAIRLQTEALKLDININYSDIFEYPTIKSLSEKKQKKQLYKIDKKYDYSKIDEIIKINNISNIDKEPITENKIGNLLLFGSTGFLGAHILDEYLSKTEGKVYCVVRKKNNEVPEERLKKTLNFYFENKYDEEFNKRIFLVHGDITKEKLGLDEKEYNQLGKDIDVVINSAALVKHFGDFEMFNSINVIGTKNIMQYCKEFNKKMYHISTMSVAGMSSLEENITDDSQRKLFCENNFYIDQNLNNAYVYTKFEAEKEILEEIQNGLNACILRMGNIFSRFRDGRFQINISENAYANRIKSILNLGVIQNRFLAHALEFTPVDFAAEAILSIVKQNSKFNIFHMFNTNVINFPNIIAILNNLGYKIDIVDDKTFANNVKQFLKDDKLKSQISGIIPELRKDKTLSLVANTLPNAYFTTMYLKSIGFNWPEIDDKYIERFLEYFKKIGYIE